MRVQKITTERLRTQISSLREKTKEINEEAISHMQADKGEVSLITVGEIWDEALKKMNGDCSKYLQKASGFEGLRGQLISPHNAEVLKELEVRELIELANIFSTYSQSLLLVRGLVDSRISQPAYDHMAIEDSYQANVTAHYLLNIAQEKLSQMEHFSE